MGRLCRGETLSFIPHLGRQGCLCHSSRPFQTYPTSLRLGSYLVRSRTHRSLVWTKMRARRREGLLYSTKLLLCSYTFVSRTVSHELLKTHLVLALDCPFSLLRNWYHYRLDLRSSHRQQGVDPVMSSGSGPQGLTKVVMHQILPFQSGRPTHTYPYKIYGLSVLNLFESHRLRGDSTVEGPVSDLVTSTSHLCQLVCSLLSSLFSPLPSLFSSFTLLPIFPIRCFSVWSSFSTFSTRSQPRRATGSGRRRLARVG